MGLESTFSKFENYLEIIVQKLKEDLPAVRNEQQVRCGQRYEDMNSEIDEREEEIMDEIIKELTSEENDIEMQQILDNFCQDEHIINSSALMISSTMVRC